MIWVKLVVPFGGAGWCRGIPASGGRSGAGMAALWSGAGGFVMADRGFGPPGLVQPRGGDAETGRRIRVGPFLWVVTPTPGGVRAASRPEDNAARLFYIAFCRGLCQGVSGQAPAGVMTRLTALLMPLMAVIWRARCSSSSSDLLRLFWTALASVTWTSSSVSIWDTEVWYM